METAQARLSLSISKCHIVGNHVSRLNYIIGRAMKSLVTKEASFYSTATCIFYDFLVTVKTAPHECVSIDR